jgi:hypothetical protein
VQDFRAHVPSVPQAKSAGQTGFPAPQTVGAQWWLAPQVCPWSQSVSLEHPARQPMFVGPQVHGSTTQMRGTPASVAQSESAVQGWLTLGQAPPQTACPGKAQSEPR